MQLEDIQTITVLGAGLMGHGIAQSFLMGGYPVQLYDVQEPILDTARTHIEQNLERFHQAELISYEDITSSLHRLSTTIDLGRAVADSAFIVEAVPEDVTLKQDLFEQVESLCGHDTILASNTSSLTLKAIGVRVQHKTRLVITHWFNPPHIVPTVEVVRGEATSDATMETVCRLLAKIKKLPVQIQRELPGFLVNRIQVAMLREVLALYTQGVASAADIDRAVQGSIGFRLASIGPLLTADLGGLALYRQVCENLLPRIHSATEPPLALQRLVAQGHDGIKTGKGFYDYAVDFSQRELDEVLHKRDREFLKRLKDLYWT
jgi:3-hydroxybutyryl-CoA dehydrogenase